MSTKPPKDLDRLEGVYFSKDGPPEFEVQLYKIERVAGDCSVDTLGLTEAESRDLLEQLKTVFSLTKTPKCVSAKTPRNARD